MRQVTTHRGYSILKSGDNYRVKTPSGTLWAEVAANLKTAKKWIDADAAEKAQPHSVSELSQAIKRAKRALNGDSNDEEHDALVELLEAVEPLASECNRLREACAAALKDFHKGQAHVATYRLLEEATK